MMRRRLELVVVGAVAALASFASPASATFTGCGDSGIAFAEAGPNVTHVYCNDGTKISIRNFD